LASSEGRIQLVLRNPTDTLKVDGTAGVVRRSLFGIAPAPAPLRVVAVRRTPPPPPPPPPPPAIIIQPPLISATIEVLSGGKKTVVELGNQPSEGVTNK